MIEWIISSSVLILMVILLRRILRGKISLRLQYGLWLLVAIRLVVPNALFESDLSVLNLVDRSPGTGIMEAAGVSMGMEDIEYVPIMPETPATDSDLQTQFVPSLGTVQGYYTGDSDHNFPVELMEAATEEEFQQLEKTIKAREILIPVWLTGAAVLGLYFIITNLRFGRALRRSRREIDVPGSHVPVYVSSAIPTPCLFGLFRPTAIYITPECEHNSETLRHVLAHESTHYRHGDHVWAALRCLELAINWYNPLVWWAAVLSKRDSELACDEGAIGLLGEEERTVYGHTLIGMTCRRSDIGSLAHTATTMTGSKKGIKERILLIAKKPRMAVYTLVAVLLVAALAVMCTFSGSNRGFTDREARRAALGLAQSVAFEAGLEIEGKGEVSRTTGHVLEQGDGLRQQYVSVRYAIKQDFREIVVDFAMMDEKGQEYDESFSASAYITKESTSIFKDGTEIESIGLYKSGYENPELEEERSQALRRYVLGLKYGAYIRHESELPEDANSEGFVVYLRDGSSLTIGLDSFDGHHLDRAEMPDWLEELFFSRELTLQEFRDSGILMDEKLLDFESRVLLCAAEVMQQDIDYLEQEHSCIIEEAQLMDIKPMYSGVAANSHSVEIYELEYRLRPDKPENISIGENMVLSDDWLINGGFGKKYFVLLNTSIGTWEHLATLTDFDLEPYFEMVEEGEYSKWTTAACMEIYEDYMETLREDIVFYEGVGEGLPEHVLDVVRYQAEWEKQDFGRLCSGISKVEVKAIIPMELGTLSHDKTGNQMYHVEYRLKVSEPDTVVLAGGVEYSDGWFTDDRYMVCELYEGKHTTNLTMFRYLTIQETYATPQYLEAYGNMFAAACAEAFIDPEYAPAPFEQSVAMVGTAAPIGCYLHERSRRIWNDGSWLYADGFPLATVLDETHVNQIPTLGYSPDLGYSAYYGLLKPLVVYNENMEPVYTEPGEDRTGTKAMRWLLPGTYYCVFGVNGKPGEYIPEAGESEYVNYDAVFRLEVSENMFTPTAAFDPKNIGEVSEIYYFGSDNRQLLFFEPEKISAICEALSTATELGYVGDCFFDDALYLVGENSTVAICLAGDACPSIYSDGKCWLLSDDDMAMLRFLLGDSIEIDINEDSYVYFCAWPIRSALQNPIIVDKDSFSIVEAALRSTSFKEISENDPEFNSDLYNLENSGDSRGPDCIDEYLFIHPYDYREDLLELLNKASKDELDALTKPECIIAHDYNIELQNDYVYVIYDGKYYLASDESERNIIDMFDHLIDNI